MSSNKGKSNGKKRVLVADEEVDPPTSPLRGGKNTPHEDDVPVSPPAEKKQRTEEFNTPKEVKQAATDPEITKALNQIVAPLETKGYENISSLVCQDAKLPAPLSKLLRPLPPHVQDEIGKELFKWWENENYFANTKFTHKSVTTTSKPVPNLKWTDLKMGPRAPVFRSPIWFHASSMDITRVAVENSGRSAKFGGGDDSRGNFFAKANVMHGNNYFAQQQREYYAFIKDKLLPMTMIMLGRSSADFRPKAQLLMRLTKDENIGGRGKYNHINDVPVDDEELIKIRDEWFEKKLIKCMHDYVGLPEGSDMFVHYTKKVDAWRDNVKIAWGNSIPIFMVVLMPDGKVQTFPVDRPDDLAQLRMSCPFGIEHTFTARVNSDEKALKLKFDLEMTGVYFFCHLKSLFMALRDNRASSQQGPSSEQTKKAAQNMYGVLEQMESNALPITHETGDGKEEFASYRVDHA